MRKYPSTISTSTSTSTNTPAPQHQKSTSPCFANPLLLFRIPGLVPAAAALLHGCKIHSSHSARRCMHSCILGSASCHTPSTSPWMLGLPSLRLDLHCHLCRRLTCASLLSTLCHLRQAFNAVPVQSTCDRVSDCACGLSSARTRRY